MNVKSYSDFAERNSLIPLRQLGNSSFKPDTFSFDSLQQQLNNAGLNINHFYFNPRDKESPYAYYHGSVLLGFSSINNKAAEIKAIIGRAETDINESVAKRNFDRFLTLVDRRLAPELFMEIFNFIPDQDKYRLFERLLKTNENSASVFSEDFISKAAKYKGVTNTQPAADEDGFIQIYLCMNSQPPEQASLWTTDINIAVLHAIQIDPVPAIYQGRIHRDNIISFDNDRKKKELQVKPDKVAQIKSLNLINMLDFASELTSSGVLQQFTAFTEKINPKWFHNPQGIHALSHTKRVLLLSLTIAHLESFNQNDSNLLGLSSIFHDIGRKTDGYDPDHGIASYEKLVNEKLYDLDHFEDRETLRFIIQNHAIPDQSAFKKLNHYDFKDVDRTLRLYDAFKDADGLDRVRINDLNPEYLRTASAHRLLLAAYQLFNGKAAFLLD